MKLSSGSRNILVEIVGKRLMDRLMEVESRNQSV